VTRQRAAAAADNDDVIVSVAHEISSLTAMSFEIESEVRVERSLRTDQESFAKNHHSQCEDAEN
jgi:hypothetical protein